MMADAMSVSHFCFVDGCSSGGRWKGGLLGAAVRRRVGKGIQGACAPMAERVRCFAAGVVERSEISEHSEHSEGLADARSWLGVGAA